MNQWSRMRKRVILGMVLFFFVVLVGIPLYLLLYRKPTCSDRAKNGDETGVDCGGSCQRLCAPESLPLVIKGDPRVLVVATSTYEVVALLENPNSDAEIRRARYTFKLYGSSSLVPLKSVTGEAYVPKGSVFALFEGPFAFEEGVVPTRAILEWENSSLVWEKGGGASPELVVSNNAFSRLTSSPRLEITVGNPTLESVSNIDLTALLYDEGRSIFAASKTFVGALPAGEEVQAIFTWPRPFRAEPVEVEVITRILPDKSFIR